MIFLDDTAIKVNGVTLPGLFKSLEITTDAQVEEQEIEGSSAKPKQVIGYEDAKIMLEIILDDGETVTKESKLQEIQNIFRKPGQAKPEVYEIVNEHTAIRGISKVIFKRLNTKITNKKEEISVSIEFWEYVPSTITATKSSSANKSSTTNTANLNANYTSYLSTSRGTAPKVQDKTTGTPAIDLKSYDPYKINKR